MAVVVSRTVALDGVLHVAMPPVWDVAGVDVTVPGPGAVPGAVAANVTVTVAVVGVAAAVAAQAPDGDLGAVGSVTGAVVLIHTVAAAAA